MMDQPLVKVMKNDCITPLGDADGTWRALVEGRSSLRAVPVLGDSGDRVPLSLFEDMTADAPPRWLPRVTGFLRPVEGAEWGGPRTPVFVASSNFGIDALYYLHTQGRMEQLPYATADSAVEHIRSAMQWRQNVAIISHACVSSHIALMAAADALRSGAGMALVVAFDFVSPFVSGGFNALKILNGGFPRPYHAGDSGSIGLGDGAAYAVLARAGGDFGIERQSSWNEMHHTTANNPDGSGFRATLAPLVHRLRGRSAWVKGHGTGTLDAGRLEATAVAETLPGAPLVGWKGAIGHTLGSCGLVELAIACRAIENGTAPGTVGSPPPYFSDNVADEPFDCSGYDCTVLLSNAFGGAHAGMLLTHD